MCKLCGVMPTKMKRKKNWCLKVALRPSGVLLVFCFFRGPTCFAGPCSGPSNRTGRRKLHTTNFIASSSCCRRRVSTRPRNVVLKRKTVTTRTQVRQGDSSYSVTLVRQSSSGGPYSHVECPPQCFAQHSSSFLLHPNILSHLHTTCPYAGNSSG